MHKNATMAKCALNRCT